MSVHSRWKELSTRGKKCDTAHAVIFVTSTRAHAMRLPFKQSNIYTHTHTHNVIVLSSLFFILSPFQNLIL